MADELRVRVQLDVGWAEYTGSYAHFVEVGDRWLPPWVEARFLSVDGQPSLWLRLEVVDGIPQCRDIRITSAPGGREVKTLDLTATRLASWVADIYAACAWTREQLPDGGFRFALRTDPAAELGARRELNEARKGRGARRLTTEFLMQVAKVYQDDVSGSPAKAVEKALGVQARTASHYVQQARKAGLLPPSERSGSNRGSNRP